MHFAFAAQRFSSRRVRRKSRCHEKL